jgi:diguanylate cyclase
VTSAGTDETDRRLYVTVGLVVVIGALFVGKAVRDLLLGPDLAHAPWLRIASFAIMVALSSSLLLTVRIKSSRHNVNTMEVVTLVGLVLIPGSWLVLLTAVGVTTVWLIKRIALIKLLFNAGKETAVVGFAVLAAEHFGGLTTRPFNVTAVLAACGAILVADEILAVPVIAMATSTPIWTFFRTNIDVRLGGMLIRLLLAGLALFGLARVPTLILLAPLVMVCLQIISANQLRARAERAAWQKLAQTTDELNEVDLDSVLASAVRRAAELFSADEVEVHVAVPAVPDRLVRGDATTVKYDGSQIAAPVRAGQVIEIPLESHDGTSGVGALRLRFFGKVTLTEREHFTLRTFAAALCTAIRNAVAFAEAERLAAEHEHAATHDPLTGLANRRQLYQTGAEILEQRPADGQIGLLLVDLNHFKEVNDTLGHVAGDRVLAEVGRRLASAAAPGDLVARLGGDEFAILFVGLPAPALAIPRAQLVLATLDQPMEIDGMRLVIEASAGVALAPSRGGIEELLRRADVAMYEAKRGGQPVALYARARDNADVGRLALTAELPRAVAEHEFAVDFQPIVDLASGEVISTEALARWHHPDRGALTPMRFLDSVERSGLLRAFSEAVLDQALAAASLWHDAGFGIPVAVNVSPRSLLDPSFPDLVAQRLRLADVPSDTLTIELTESLTLSQLDVVDEVLRALRDLGIRLALDDFGTGYSSLATLARVPVHELKIDRAFVAAMDSASADAAVVRSTIELGRSLDLLVVAEGVESEEQRRRLWEQGCPAGQGHLFGRPMPVNQLIAALRRGYGGKPATLAAPLHDGGSVIRLPARRSAQQRQGELG